MALSDRIKDGLDRAAHIIAANDLGAMANIFNIKDHGDMIQFGDELNAVADEAVAYLRQGVEHHSGGSRTIRRAEWYLFDSPPPHNTGTICLVAGKADLPEGTVNELGDDISLITIAAHYDALLTNKQPAKPEDIDRRLRHAAMCKDEAALRDPVDAEIAGFLTILLIKLRRTADYCRNPVAAAEAKQEIDNIVHPTIEQVAALCIKLDTKMEYLLNEDI